MFWYWHVYWFCLHWNNTKNLRKKAKSDIIPHRTPKINWDQSLPVTINAFLTPLYWNFGPLFFCQLLQVSQIWRLAYPNCWFEISPQVFYEISIWTYCWPLQNSPALCFRPFLCAFWSMLWVIVLLEDPWPLTETQLSDTGPYIALHNSLVVLRFHDAMHTVKASGARSSKATPKHLWTSTMFDRRDRVLFFEGLI